MERTTSSAARLPRLLGWASLGLGVPQTLTPGRFARFIGVEDDSTTRAIVLGACGLRENAAAAGLLALHRDRPAGWLWARVAGDGLDLALLALALRGRSEQRQRTLAAAGAVLGVAALDVVAAVRAGRSGSEREEQQVTQIKHAITIRGERAEIERRWREHNESNEAGWYRRATVSFKDAPGDRGTEIHVSLEHDPPLGVLGKAAGKVTGNDPGNDAKDALRHFKQIVETGEIVRSDGTPEGQKATRQFKQRPAQPVDEPVGTGA